uniref:CAC1F_C domain-containing protein n=1 Tax=Macrostomum lignano TaxID=282301 RepID=A0A1I8F2X0_9PLAT
MAVTSNLLVPAASEKSSRVGQSTSAALRQRFWSPTRAPCIERARVEARTTASKSTSRDVTRVPAATSALGVRGTMPAKEHEARPFGVWHCCSWTWTPPAPGCSTWTLLAPTLILSAPKAIGSGHEGAQQQLEEAYHSGMSLRDALVLALNLKQVMEEKLDMTNVEYHLLAKEEVEAVIAEVEQLWALS